VLINDVLERSPQSLAALTLMARASLLGDRPAPDRAIEHLERAVTIYPRQTGLHERLIALLQERGDFEAAQRYLSRLSMLSEDRPDLQRTEMQLLQTQGDFERALVRASTLIGEQSPASPDALSFALGTRAIWKRPELVRQAIDGLETLLGACSRRPPSSRSPAGSTRGSPSSPTPSSTSTPAGGRC
jgi:tetratricopeptide (TPR) repeat protein